jgi:hypothetical protein
LGSVPAHPITALLQSILRRPQLAAYIRRVSLVGTSFDRPHYGSKTPRLPVSESTLKEVLAFVAKAKVSYRETWLEELRNGKMDAFVAVLLCQPSYLTYLFLGPDFFLKESQIVGLVLRSTLCETSDCGLGGDFEHFRSVTFGQYVEYSDHYVHYSAYKVHRNTADVLPLFYLPSVTEISVPIDNPTTFPWPAAHPPSCPSLRSLEITNIRESFLGQLLSVTPQVQSLKWLWRHVPDFRDQVNTPIIDLGQFMTAISHLRNTLEELVVLAICWHDSAGIVDPPLTIQGSFKAIADFDMLRKFTAPFALLLGFQADVTKQIQDFLPRNLEFLTITDNLWAH